MGSLLGLFAYTLRRLHWWRLHLLSNRSKFRTRTSTLKWCEINKKGCPRFRIRPIAICFSECIISFFSASIHLLMHSLFNAILKQLLVVSIWLILFC
eukprot:Gb_20024 [translate_table: standard]